MLLKSFTKCRGTLTGLSRKVIAINKVPQMWGTLNQYVKTTV